MEKAGGTNEKDRKKKVMEKMLMGRKELIGKGTMIKVETEGIMIGSIKKGEERWKIIGDVCEKRGVREDIRRIRTVDEGKRGRGWYIL